MGGRGQCVAIVGGAEVGTAVVEEDTTGVDVSSDDLGSCRFLATAIPTGIPFPRI